jgi:two-component system alkaline phosphatase synthesis response regulator PhoP
LIVEDDTKIAELISTELTLEGYKVTVASDGMEALGVAREYPPDLIILERKYIL